MYYSKEEKQRRRVFWEIYEKEYNRRIRGLWDGLDNPSVESFTEIVTWDVVEENKDIDWKMYCLSKNENIGWEIVKKNLDKNWNWDELSQRIPYQIIKETDHPWNYHMVSVNPTLTLSDVKEDRERRWNWDILSQTPNIVKSWATYLNNKDLPWVINRLVSNTNVIPGEALAKSPELFDDDRIWSCMSWNINLTWDDVKGRLDKKWNWDALSENGKVIKSYEMFCELSWNHPVEISTYSQNPTLTWEVVNSNIMVDWDMEGLSSNRNVITFDIIKERDKLRARKKWNWYFLSMNESVATEKTVLENPNFPWDFSALSGNREVVSWKVSQKYVNEPWEWICVDLILKEKLIVEMAREHLAAYRIQWYWRTYLENPNHNCGYMHTKAKLFDHLVEEME